MEKSTISALIVAGSSVLVGIVQVGVLRAARRHRKSENEDAVEKRSEDLPGP